MPSSSGMVKANDDGACLAFDSRMLKLKMKSRRDRAGRRGRARVSAVDCARSPYGESTFKRNRPSFAVLMVLGWGGGVKTQKSSPRHWQGLANLARRTMQVQLPTHLATSYITSCWTARHGWSMLTDEPYSS